jgi:hypothetical protein
VACVCAGGDMHLGFSWGNLNGRDHFEDLGLDGRMMINCVSKKQDGRAQAGFMQLRM